MTDRPTWRRGGIPTECCRLPGGGGLGQGVGWGGYNNGATVQHSLEKKKTQINLTFSLCFSSEVPQNESRKISTKWCQDGCVTTKVHFSFLFPSFPKESLSPSSYKKKITFLTFVQQKCDIVHPFLSSFFFFGLIDEEWMVSTVTKSAL